jgi:hypothetical protein
LKSRVFEKPEIVAQSDKFEFAFKKPGKTIPVGKGSSTRPTNEEIYEDSYCRKGWRKNEKGNNPAFCLPLDLEHLQ